MTDSSQSSSLRKFCSLLQDKSSSRIDFGSASIAKSESWFDARSNRVKFCSNCNESIGIPERLHRLRRKMLRERYRRTRSSRIPPIGLSEKSTKVNVSSEKHSQDAFSVLFIDRLTFNPCRRSKSTSKSGEERPILATLSFPVARARLTAIFARLRGDEFSSVALLLIEASPVSPWAAAKAGLSCRRCRPLFLGPVVIVASIVIPVTSRLFHS